MTCTDETALGSGTVWVLVKTRMNRIGIEKFTTVPTWRGEGGPVAPEAGIPPDGAGDLVALHLFEFFAGYGGEVA